MIDGIISGSTDGHYLYGSPGAFSGLSGGPVLEKFASGGGRLLGICSGSKDDGKLGPNSSYAETFNAINDARTDLPCVLIVPAAHFVFGKLNFKFNHCIRSITF
jgi:hypothetical protein